MINKLGNKGDKTFNQKNHGKRYLKLKNFLKIGTSAFLFIGGITSIVFSSLSAINSGAPKDQFGDAYNAQYKVQLSSINTSGEDNLNTTGVAELSKDDAMERLKASADAFKHFLVSKNIDFEGVQYSLDELPSDSNEYTGTIYTNFFNIEQLSSTSSSVTIDFPRSMGEIILTNASSNFIEIVPFNTTNDLSINRDFYDANLNQPIFNNYGLDFANAQIQSGNEDNENKYDDSDHIITTPKTPINISDFPESLELRQGISDTTLQSELDKRKMVVFKDVNLLVQKMNYSNLLNFWIREANANNFIHRTLWEFSKINPNPALPEEILVLPYPTEILTADVYHNFLVVKDETHESGIDIAKTSQNILQYVNETSKSFWGKFPTLKSWTDKTFSNISNQNDAPQIVSKTDVYLMANGVRLDGSRYVDITGQSSRNVISDAIYNEFSQQLVQEMAVVNEITLQNYSEFFPQTNTIDEDLEALTSPGQVDNITQIAWPTASLDRFSFGNLTDFSLKNYLNQIKKVSTLSQGNIGNLNSFPPQNDTKFSSVATLGGNSRYQFGATIHAPTILQVKIGGLSIYNSMFLIIGVILLLVGIIVSILYRVPGLFAFLAMGATTTFTAGLLGALNFNFSFGLFLGITFIVILSLASILLILERCRKQFLERKPAFEAGMGSIRKTLISIIDLHVGSILISLGLVFLGSGEVQDFGFAIIVGGTLSFLSLLLFFIVNFYLFFSDVRNRSIKFYFFGKVNQVKPTNDSQLIPNINSNHSVLEKGLKLHFNWKITVVVIGVLLLIAIIIITLIFTIGFPNSLDFNKGNVIYISGSDLNSKFGEFQSILGVNWIPIIVSDTILSFGKSNHGEFGDLIEKLQAIDANATINTTIASDVASMEIFEKNIVALIAGIGFSGLYGLLRFNFYGGIPIFISTLFGSWLGISFAYGLFFLIGINSVLSFVFATSICYLMSMGYVSVTNSRFSKKEVFNRKKIGEFINANANNLKYYWISIVIIVIAIAIAQFAFASPSFYWIIGTILLSTIVGIAASIVLVMTSYYGFILLRQLYIKNTIHDSITNRSSKYDSLDEELIKGINYYE